MMTRCPWAATEASILYHDREWGAPLHGDILLFEMLTLEGAQAGLSWETILRKRAAYREAFEGFDPAVVARFSQRRVEQLLKIPGIVRNRLKVESTVSNARAALKAQEEIGSLDALMWGLAGDAPQVNAWRSMKDVPAKTPQAEAMSKALKKRGFRFVGPTICYAFMQATGMVNDHLLECPRRQQIISENR